MNVHVEIAQRGDGIREITFDSEVEVALKLALQSDPCPTKKEAVRRMISRLISAEVELPVAAYLRFEGAIGAAHKSMILPPNQWQRLVLRL